MKSFTQWILEGRSFSYSGSVYSSGFGRYTKDGLSITKDEYQKASDAYKNKDVTQKEVSKKNGSLETSFDNVHKYSKTFSLLKETPYTPSKSLKECEEKLSKMTGKNVFLSGITNKELYNGIAESVYKVFSRYPYLGDSDCINYFATQTGMNKSVELDVEEYINSDEIKKSIQKDLDWVIYKHDFGKVGEPSGKQVRLLGLSSKETNAFLEKYKLDWLSPLSEEASNAMKERFISERLKHKKKNYRENMMPSIFITKNAYASYIDTEDDLSSYKRYTGVYFNPSNMKHALTVYEKEVENGSNPKGTTHTAITTHELGHALDKMLSLETDEELNRLYQTEDVSNSVSKYAKTSVKEFIAECFCEYLNSSQPRELSVKVGKIIDKKYQVYSLATKLVYDKIEKGEIEKNQLDVYRSTVLFNLNNSKEKI